MKRRTRPFAALLAILALLFAQAMASVHACDVASAKAPVTASAPAMDGDCCDHGVPPLDPACDNHCQQGKQAPERAQSPAVAPLVALGFMTATAIVAVPDVSASPPIAAPDLARGTQPPIPIRNCCFRI
jgi:hypothetical protein